MYPPKPAIPDRKELEECYQLKMPQYKVTLETLIGEIQNLFQKGPVHPTVKGRVKSFESYYRKILRKLRERAERGRPAGRCLPVISDIIGIRIVCPFLEDLRIAKNTVMDAFKVVKVEHKGENRNVNEFGYESTHILLKIPPSILSRHHIEENLPCEIQLQTTLQDAWAEVEHELVYKADFSPFDEPMKRKLAALNAMLTLSDTLFQEILDYQNKLSEQLQKRRDTFTSKVQSDISTAMINSLSKDLTGESMCMTEVNSRDFQSIDIRGKNIDELLLQALYAHNARQFDLAIALYTKILEFDLPRPVCAVILVHRGMAQFAKSNYRSAQEDFSLALESDGKNSKALYCRGITNYIQKNYTEALADFSRNLELDPFNLDSLYGRAQTFYQLGNYQGALSDCEKALCVDPSLKEVQTFFEFVRYHLDFQP